MHSQQNLVFHVFMVLYVHYGAPLGSELPRINISSHIFIPEARRTVFADSVIH